MRSREACLIAVIGVVACSAVAAPTDLDPTFGSGGIVRFPGYATARSAAQLSDGSLVTILTARETSAAFKLGPSGTLDNSFLPIAPVPATANAGPASLTAVAALPDGRVVVRQEQVVPSSMFGCNNYVGRYLVTGAPDPSFNGGQPEIAGACILGYSGLAPSWVTAAPSGDTYFSSITSGARFLSSDVFRVSPPGAPVDRIARFSTFTPSDSTAQGTFGKIVVAPDGKLLIVVDFSSTWSGGGLAVLRLVGSAPDPTFGTNGLANLPSAVLPIPTDMLLMPDGRILVAGVSYVDAAPVALVARFTANGQIDPSFGSGGLAVLKLGRTFESIKTFFQRIALLADGRVVFAGTVEKRSPSGEPFPRIVVARLTAGGTPDPTFAPGGIHDLWLLRGTELGFLESRPDGRIVLGTSLWTDWAIPNGPTAEAAVVQLQGGNAPAALPLRERAAIEYIHGAFGHYFLTANPEEIAYLDTATGTGWTRTGRMISVWDGDDPTVLPVCRFWSDQTWAPKSSHFYTPYPHECQIVKADPAWRFETNAFMLKLPEGQMGSRTCPVGSQPLYRAYNNGISGAPNHRYTTDPTVLDAMIARGWAMEGEATTRVFACVPVQ